MRALLIVNNDSANQDEIVAVLSEAQVQDLTPCTYKDTNLFVSDPSYQFFFVEINEFDIDVTLSLIAEIKAINPAAQVFPVLNSKDSDLILKLVKSDIDDILTLPLNAEEISTLLQKSGFSGSAASSVNKGLAQIITVSSYKGGTGVSTIVTNLGFCLSELSALNRRVAIVDLANQSNHCTVLLGGQLGLTINEICANADRLSSNYITSACSWITDRLAIIGSDMGIDTVVQGLDYEALKVAINLLTNDFDYVLIDLPTHSFDSRFLASMEISDQIIIVSTLEITSIKDTKTYMQILSEIGIDHNKVRILLNRYDSQSGGLFSNQDLERSFENPISFYVHNDFFGANSATQSQMAIIESNPKSIIAEDFAELAVGIDSGLTFVPPKIRGNSKQKKSSSLFSKLMGKH